MEEGNQANLRGCYYASSIGSFLTASPDEVLGTLTREGQFDLEMTQRDAWRGEIQILKSLLERYAGRGGILFEFSVPRLGKRIDVVLIVDHTIFVLEFKVGEQTFTRAAIEQVWDYALDLRNFHDTSHASPIAPILIATNVQAGEAVEPTWSPDGVARPIRSSPQTLTRCIDSVLATSSGSLIDWEHWQRGRYSPTPTIIEAAKALYKRHSVDALSRQDAGAKNLSRTSRAVTAIVSEARREGVKAICFVTGVPGAGKTLVGLDVATRHMDPASELHSVYLSGNGPLVSILQEALARDTVQQATERGEVMRKGEARQKVQAFIQNVHHFRDDCLQSTSAPPEHVAIFDEAQRAWNQAKTSDFMARKKGRSDFTQSESQFLISCLDRHDDWAVVVCLVGGGQEINTGEAGISEWIASILNSFPDWTIHISPQLHDSEYAAADALTQVPSDRLCLNEDLHLAVSMRSFRAETLSTFVKQVLDLELETAARSLAQIAKRYPLCLTRDLTKAKRWLRDRARGSERYGMVVSSQAQRLRPHAIDVRAPMDPVHWFLDGKEDIRSSFYLEDVATEFDVQGLELDWTCVVWDADFRHFRDGWQHHSFVGDRWQRILKTDRQAYLKNAYRVLLTRARQGMVIVVPEGSDEDPTRAPAYYDGTFDYLRSIGIPIL
jgi:hypothetical protein